MPNSGPDRSRSLGDRLRSWLSLKIGRQRRRLTFCLAVGPVGTSSAITSPPIPRLTATQAGFVGARTASSDATGYSFFCLPDRTRIYFTVQAVVLAVVLGGWYGVAATAFLLALVALRRSLRWSLAALAASVLILMVAGGVLAPDRAERPDPLGPLTAAALVLIAPGLVGIVVYGLLRRPVLAGHVLTGLDPQRFGPAIARAAAIRRDGRAGFYWALFLHTLPFHHCFDRMSAVQFSGPDCEQGRYIRLASEQLLRSERPASAQKPPAIRRADPSDAVPKEDADGKSLPISRWILYGITPVWAMFIQLSIIALLPIPNHSKSTLILSWVILSIVFFYLEVQPMIDDLRMTPEDRRTFHRDRTVGNIYSVRNLLEHTVFFTGANLTVSVLAVFLLSLAQLWGQNDVR